MTSPTERMRLGVGACRRLEQAPVDRLVFLACAGAFCERPSGTTRLTRIARLAGLPAAAVWEVIARHALLDGSHDSWVEFAFEEVAWAPTEGTDEEVPRPPEGVIGVWGCEDLTLRVTYPAWPRDFIDLVLRRWPDDFLALTTDLLCDVWDGSDEGFGPAAWFLGEVFDCLQPDWYLDLWVEGMLRVQGNLAFRSTEMPSRDFVPHPDHDLVRRRMLPEAARAELYERLARRLLVLDLGSLPERILECPPDEWLSAGQLLCVLFKRKLPGVNERLEERLFRGDGLFDFLAAMAECESRHNLEWGVGLLYDMTTGSEGGARRFVEALRARHGYDLPQPLRKALVERLSLGLAGIVEAVDTADPTTGVEIMGIFKRWREELDRFRWRQSVGFEDHSDWEEEKARGAHIGLPDGSGE
ncbi:MAG: hypothetical protein ACYC5Q_11225 [Thermoleophilia bacterium]